MKIDAGLFEPELELALNLAGAETVELLGKEKGGFGEERFFLAKLVAQESLEVLLKLSGEDDGLVALFLLAFLGPAFNSDLNGSLGGLGYVET
jgi:hypothetical protein